MATLQGKAVKNTYRQVLQIGANNVGVSGTLQPVQDGTGTNTALSLSTAAATINGTLTITGDLIITGGGIQIQDLIDDTVASLIQNGTGITWAYNDTLRTLTPTITIATADGGVQGDFLQFNVNANEASAVGKLKWNTTDGTMDIGLMGGNVVLQVGQEQVARVLNNSGTIFTEAGYQAVKITSAQGQRLAVGLAQANNEANSKDTLGLVTENIANNQEGFVTTSGLVREIDTTGDLQTEVWVDGDTLYLSPYVPGGVTKVKPLAPQQTVIVGFVVYAHKNHGKIFVKVDNGYEISELHDVRITSVANNNVLKYNSSLAVWENVAPITTWITEGTNLYYTQGRFDSAFAAKSTTNLAEGTNLYFTTARGDVNFATNFATKTTTNLPEGTNLYFTNQRFDTRFSTKTTTDLAEGTNLYYTQARFNTAFAAKSTTDLAEGTNLYYTDARARLAISESAVGLDYSNTSGVFSLTAGYAIPTTVKLGQYDTAYNRSIISAGVTGTTTKTLSLTQQDANVITASWTDQGITTINGTANQIAANTVGNTTTIAFTNDVTMPNNLVVSGNLTINGTATYVNTQSISAKDPLFEVANDNNTTDAVDIGYYGRFYDSAQTRVEFTGLFRDASDAGKFKFFTGLVDEPTNVVNTTGTGYTVGTLVANFEGNLAGTANAANVLSTARSISATGDAAWTVNFDGSANATAALTLANTGVTATTYGTTTAVPTIAIDSKGRITSASNTNIAFPVTTVNGASGTVVLTTTNIAEGTNQYFTTAKVSAYLTGAISPILTSDLTASRALVSDGTGKITASASTTSTELSYVAGVTSAIQTQLNSKLNLSGGTLTGPLIGTTSTFSGIGTFGSSAGSGLRVYGGSGTNQWDIYLNSTNLRFSDNTGTGSIIFDRPLSGTSSTFSGTVVSSQLQGSAASDQLKLILSSDTSYNTVYNVNGINLFGAGQSYSIKFASGTPAFTIASNGDSRFNTNLVVGSILTARQGYTVAGNSTNPYFDQAIILDPSGNGTSSAYIKVGNQYASDYGTSLKFTVNGPSGPNLPVDVMTMRSSGFTGIGTSSPATLLHIASSGNTFLTIDAASANNSGITFYKSGAAAGAIYYLGASDAMRFDIAGNERMRITSGGNVSIDMGASPTARLAIGGPSTTESIIYAEKGSASFTGSIITSLTYTGAGTGWNHYIGYSNIGATVNIKILGNGNVQNANNSYGAISDIRLKENIVNASPKLDDLLKVKIRNYNLIGDESKQLGVIAQELEEIFPSMIDETNDIDKDGNDLGTTTKSVKYSVFVPMLIKAIQELKAEIDELKAK